MFQFKVPFEVNEVYQFANAVCSTEFNETPNLTKNEKKKKIKKIRKIKN